MSIWTRRLSVPLSSLMTLALVGCSQGHEGWTPVLEETSTIFLRTETEAVAASVHQAQLDLPESPETAAIELAAAEDRLDHLLTYYLPLLDARERAYNAYRHYYLGETGESARKLDEVEEILMTIAETGHGHLLREMKEPLERLEDAKAALAADNGEAAEALRALATRLNFLLVRGGLVLTE